MEFAWDEAKAAANLRKHRVSFDDAREALRGYVLQLPDDRFDYGEDRWVGFAAWHGAVFVVAYTMRSDTIRIISARHATPRERRLFHESEARRDRL